jgi:hypothetical protein
MKAITSLRESGQWKLISKELARHAPFTAFGAITGIVIMVAIIFGDVPSGIVTTAIYKLHGSSKLWVAILIGYTGSIGIATISDSVIPYLGGALLDIKMGFHVGFIEKWWLVNPMAFLGIAIGYWRPTTKFPHAGHVLLSTWASLFYFTAFGVADWLPLLPVIFLFLFLSVWVPCCLSDIAYPLLFVRMKRP